VQAIVAKVITERPTPPRTVRDTIAPHVESAVLRALAKLPADRFMSASQFAEALARDTQSSATGARATATERPARQRRALIGLSVAAVVLGVAAATGWWKATHPAPAAPVRFTLTLGPNEVLMDPVGRSIAVSPNGRLVAYFASDGAARGIHVRDLGEARGRAIAGTDAAGDFRFSPDGKAIAYYTGFSGREPRGIFTIPVAGGPAALVRAGNTSWQGMGWAHAEPIVYHANSQLWKVSPRGGMPELIVTPDSGALLNAIGDPFVLPDGKTVTFRGATASGQRLGLGDIAGGRFTMLDIEGSNVLGYVDGWLVFGRADGTIAAAKVNLVNGDVTSDVVHIMAGVKVRPNIGIIAAMSRHGETLAFLSGSVGRSLAIVDERGSTIDTGPEQLHYEYPAWSPDGKRVVANVSMTTGGRRTYELRVLDVEARTLSRITADHGTRLRTTWTPDGSRVAYVRSGRPGMPPGIYWVRADGSGQEERLVQGLFRHIGFARDGRLFAIGIDTTATDSLRQTGIWVIDTSRVVPATPVVTGLARLIAPAVSPDGRWLAYQSEETGRPEVYVLSLSSDGTRVQITTGGGIEPRWSPDGTRIYYRTGTGTFRAATIAERGGSIAVVRRDSLFRDRYASFDGTNPDYDVHPDGKRFVFLDDAADQIRVEVVVNWLTELRAKLEAASRE
jgi:Tol biopolymer transport system component